MWFALLFASVLTASLEVLALPTSLEERLADAPYTVDAATLAASITCPQGLRSAKGGIVFLVHGTGTTAEQSWAGGPYDVYLPYASPGFDVCWVELPNKALGDAQVSSEYVAYNIPRLAKKSATGKIAVIGHSQGAGLTIQWALDFWPSTRKYVTDYIALAGDFHGTDEGPLACALEDIDSGGCHYAILQQTTGSHYLAAQNKRGGSALVTTTSLYTHYDDVIQNEVGPNATSILPGAENIAIQDLDICGPLHYVEHFTMLTDPAAYYLAYDALTHSGPASPARFQKKYCDYFTNSTALDGYLPAQLESIVLAALALFTPIGSPGAKSIVEPPLMKYVCAEGQSTYCS